jgi:hypothetical protein
VRAVQRFSRHRDLNVLCVYDDARRDLAGEISKLVAKHTIPCFVCRAPPVFRECFDWGTGEDGGLRLEHSEGR